MKTHTLPLLHKAAKLLKLEVEDEYHGSLIVRQNSCPVLWNPAKNLEQAITLAMTLKIDLVHAFDDVLAVSETTASYLANPKDLDSVCLAILQTAAEMYDNECGKT